MTIGVRMRRAAAAIAIVPLLGLSACSSDGDPEPGMGSPTIASAAPIPAGGAPLRVELIGRAIEAVESDRGGPQRFFEVNATPTLVNLFVAADNATQAVAYVFAAGALEPAAASQPASGPTFSSADVDFDESLVLAKVSAELTSSVFRLFSITGVESGGAQYSVVLDSSQGTEFVVFVGGTGAILGTDQTLGAEQS